jgi:biopolymer transport protein ExbD
LYLKQSPTGRTVVQVNAGGHVYDDYEQLKATLFGLAEVGREEIPIILDIAPDVPLGDMIQVYDTCRAAEFRSIHFATDPSHR